MSSPRYLCDLSGSAAKVFLLPYSPRSVFPGSILRIRNDGMSAANAETPSSTPAIPANVTGSFGRTPSALRRVAIAEPAALAQRDAHRHNGAENINLKRN